ncbi:MAG TPA: right-handed parallel beta-helix repeat-containing protein, partial [Longimicrobium sp.]
MSKRIDNFIIRQPDGSVRFSNSLVLGGGLLVTDTAGGIPELRTGGEVLLAPSGGEDSGHIQTALDTPGVSRVRLAPGSYQVLAPITLHDGQVLVGSGPELTILNANVPIATLTLGEVDSGVESLSIVGAGISILGSGSNLRVVDVHTLYADEAIVLTGDRMLVSRCRLISTGGGDAIHLAGGEQNTVTDVSIDGADGAGLHFSGSDCVRVAGATIRNCGVGIVHTDGSAHSYTAVRISTCPQAMQMTTCGSVSLTGVQAAECDSGFSFTAIDDLSVAACSLTHGSNNALVLNNCHDVTVSAFHADLSNGGATPQVTVSGGSTLVFFSSINRVVGSFA